MDKVFRKSGFYVYFDPFMEKIRTKIKVFNLFINVSKADNVEICQLFYGLIRKNMKYQYFSFEIDFDIIVIKEKSFVFFDV